MDQNTIKKVAKLARIRLTDKEVGEYTEKLGGILKWVEQLQAINTDGVEPMAGVGEYTLRWREDKITDGNIQDDVLKNAPGAEYGCYVVPKVVE